MSFLPVCKKDLKENNIDILDFIIVTGDAYVDHPSFGTAIISRVLESKGFKVGIIPQPDWKKDESFKILGKPRYAFLVNSGNLDSMVAHYTAAKKRRSEDFYSPGKKAGKRPDRAVIVYSKKIREIFPHSDIVIGGLEASLRRFSHYDYWADKVMPSVLFDSMADLLIYGMGENQIIEMAENYKSGKKAKDMTDIKGTCYLTEDISSLKDYVSCPSFDNVLKSKEKYALATRLQYENHDCVSGKDVVQKHYDKYLVQKKPMPPLTQKEMDEVYSLPYMRYYHPMYEKEGGVPAIEEVEFSIAHNRGCFGGCNFCALAFHQGRMITTRSKNSIVEEAKKITQSPRFKGYIHDIGGPTANFRHNSCDKQDKHGMCTNRKCLAPTPCPNIKADHSEYLDILREVRSLPKIKKVFVRSGIRFDYLILDKDDTFFKELVEHHISGQLKVAPEHICDNVLSYMGKPVFKTYSKFKDKYKALNHQKGKEQYLVPYLMSSHPGSTLNDAINLVLYLKRNHLHPQQVQDFYPTPGTISTCMYYTEINPIDMKKVYVPKTEEEKARQRALLQYKNEKNIPIIEKALHLAHREDLMGTGKD
ncbi:MAG: YgiQ family radical SAM protein, partial [Clostridia bacterium]|nr:YgiQ family radical SAM protein [Clostridia bacterium]